MFWKLTPGDFFAAIDGYLEANGASKESGVKPMTKAELAAYVQEQGIAK